MQSACTFRLHAGRGSNHDAALLALLWAFFLETIVLLLVALTSSDWGPVILLPPGDIGPLLHRPVISGLRLRGDGDGGLAAAGDEF